MAELIFHEKVVAEDGDIMEMRILLVPTSAAHPQGVRYALVYIHLGRRVVGYDNFEGKGHHKHWGKEESPYEFKDVESLVHDFKEDVQRWKSKKSKLE